MNGIINMGLLLCLAAGMAVAQSPATNTAAAKPANMPATLANPADPLAAVKKQLALKWPANRTINIVCHGHSVPSGYFKTPVVSTFDAYPHLLHRAIKEAYPYAVVNVIVTSIGGEQSEQGAARFEKEVLSMRPDVITLDYGLNDRRMGLERARVAWQSMIDKAASAGVPVILLTPTWDSHASMNNPEDPLNQHAAQIRALAATNACPLVDSSALFKAHVDAGGRVDDLLAQFNHPNRACHQLVADKLGKLFTP